jgi:hypothetical protein
MHRQLPVDTLVWVLLGPSCLRLLLIVPQSLYLDCELLFTLLLLQLEMQPPLLVSRRACCEGHEQRGPIIAWVHS